MDASVAMERLDTLTWLLRFATGQWTIASEVLVCKHGKAVGQVFRSGVPGPWAPPSSVFVTHGPFGRAMPGEDVPLITFLRAALPVMEGLDATRQKAVRSIIDIYIHALGPALFPVPVYDIAYAFEVLREHFLSEKDQRYVPSLSGSQFKKRVHAMTAILEVYFRTSLSADMPSHLHDRFLEKLSANVTSILRLDFRDNVRQLLHNYSVDLPPPDAATGNDWVDDFVNLRNKCIHGHAPFDAEAIRRWMRATCLLDQFMLRLFSYSGRYYNRVARMELPLPPLPEPTSAPPPVP